MVTHISFWVSNIGDSMISSAVWTTNILKLCLTGMVCLPRLMACLFGAMVICMFLVENFIIVLIKQHKQCVKDTQKPFLLIGKESRIILTLSLGMLHIYKYIYIYMLSYIERSDLKCLQTQIRYYWYGFYVT